MQRRSAMKKISIFKIGFLTLFLGSLTQCSTGLDPISSDDSPTVLTITGKVTTPTPTASLSSLSALVSDEADDLINAAESEDTGSFTNIAESDCTAEAYTLEGNYLGNAVSNADGNYTFEIKDLNEIRPTSVIDATAIFRPQIIVSVDCGNRHFENFVGPEIDPSSTNEIAAGKANMASTLALTSVVTNNISNFQGWGADYSNDVEKIGQKFIMNLSFYEKSKSSDSSDTFASRYSSLKALMLGFYAGGGDYSAMGYATPMDLIQDYLKGTMNTTALEKMIDTYSTVSTIDRNNVLTNFTTYTNDLKTIDGYLDSNFYGAGVSDNVSTDLEWEALARTCARIPVSSAGTTFNNAGTFSVALETYRKAYESAADPSSFVFDSGTTAALLTNYGGTALGSYYSDASARDTFIDTMYETVARMSDQCAAVTFDKCANYAGVWKTVYESYGYDYCGSNGNCFDGLDNYILTSAKAGDTITNFMPPSASYLMDSTYLNCISTAIAGSNTNGAISCMSWLDNTSVANLTTIAGGQQLQQQPPPPPPPQFVMIRPTAISCKDDGGTDNNIPTDDCVFNMGSPGNPIANLMDSDINTGNHIAGPNYPIVISLDLGSNKNVRMVEIHHVSNNVGNQIKNGFVQHSTDGINWTNFGGPLPPYDANSNIRVTALLPPDVNPVTARYIRIINSENQNGSAGWYPSEFAVSVVQ